MGLPFCRLGARKSNNRTNHSKNDGPDARTKRTRMSVSHLDLLIDSTLRMMLFRFKPPNFDTHVVVETFGCQAAGRSSSQACRSNWIRNRLI
jgi:hypothetical protein